MAFVALTDEEIVAGQPVKQELMNKIQDNFDDLDTRVGDIESLPTVVLPNGKILIGNASNVPTAVTMSGDATITNTGVITVANDAITTVKILNSNVTTAKIADDAITTAKLATPNSDYVNFTASSSTTSSTFQSLGSRTIVTNSRPVLVMLQPQSDGNISYFAVEGTSTAEIEVKITSNKDGAGENDQCVWRFRNNASTQIKFPSSLFYFDRESIGAAGSYVYTAYYRSVDGATSVTAQNIALVVMEI